MTTNVPITTRINDRVASINDRAGRLCSRIDATFSIELKTHPSSGIRFLHLGVLLFINFGRCALRATVVLHRRDLNRLSRLDSKKYLYVARRGTARRRH